MNHQKEIEKIKESIKSGALCAINRDVIDTLSIYGFPVEMSDTLAAVAFVYDFMPDGYKIVRTSDITEVFAAEAEQFLERIVKTERPAFVPERTGLALGSMYELCEDLKAPGQLCYGGVRGVRGKYIFDRKDYESNKKRADAAHL